MVVWVKRGGSSVMVGVSASQKGFTDDGGIAVQANNPPLVRQLKACPNEQAEQFMYRDNAIMRQANA